MTQPEQPRRTRERSRDERGVVAPSRVMLVAIVLVAIAAATYLAGLGSPSGSDDTATQSAARTTAGDGSASPSASGSPSTASTEPSPSATASASKKPSPTASPTAAPTAAAVRRGSVRVSVFNNSSVTGLAARTSSKVKSAGWDVVGTDNWYGSIPSATVYYPEGLERAARLLAKDIGVSRVRPSVTPMRNDRLTVIVTSEYDA